MEQFVATAALFTIGILIPRVDGGCSMSCTKDAYPVCGHSPTYGFKNFLDKCALEQSNLCGHEDWTLIHPKGCTPNEIRGCPFHFGPVCGHSPTHGYKSFLNKCFLDIVAELSDYTFAHDGACTPDKVPPSVCPGACPEVYSPVCGYSPASGYRIFPNSCFLKLENTCFFGSYSLSHSGLCTDKELNYNCHRACTKEYLPVCGLSTKKGYKTFSNLCMFYVENGCPKYDSDYKLIHAGACKPDEIASFCKPKFCPDIYNPVCATSLPFYRTFRNKCLFYVENSCKNGDFQLLHKGECTEKENYKSCSVLCTQEKAPVCAFSPVRGYKTFNNKCYFNYENACSGSDYGIIRLGECKKDELGLICTEKFCPKSKAKPVCGRSPTKGYTSFDNECFLYAENTCKYGDYKLAHLGECTKKECDMFCLPDFCLKPSPPVCGYSKKTGYFTFPNLCYLYSENTCKGKDFILKHKGKCTSLEVGGKCPLTCNQEFQYLCGLSHSLGYKTFRNKCTLDAANECNGGDYQLKHHGECTKEELEKNCQKLCTSEYKPVCAISPTKGHHTFPNECSYILDITCYGSDYQFEHGGVCKHPDVPPPSSPQCHFVETVCPKGNTPVCGFSKSNKAFQTFPNKCLFEFDNKCKYDFDFIFAHDGACYPNELNNNCYRKCPPKILPVCGVSPTLGYKDFKSLCELLYGLSCQRSDFTLEHEGKCTSIEAPTCSSHCPKISNPICVFSPSKKVFKTLGNKCILEWENQCNFGDYIIAHAEECTKPELENDCKRACTLIYKPVCGYSFTKGYKTFGNVCSFILDISCLGGDYIFSNEGECKYPEGPQKDCPASCPKNIKEVCTFSSNTKSYRTFLNQCFWAAENRCNYGDYVFIHAEKCTKGETDKKCYRKCPLIYKPVCGVDVILGGRTFPSLCELEVANKCDGADYSLKHVGKCTFDELGGACNHNCPLYYIGVCGYSDIKGLKTFANECFLDRENTCTFSDYKIRHTGKCTPKETGNKCKRICQLIYSPVCGKSHSKGYKTFPNFCHLDLENSCLYLDYNVIHQGECFPWELCVNCKP